jgi:hypothetical protein
MAGIASGGAGLPARLMMQYVSCLQFSSDPPSSYTFRIFCKLHVTVPDVLRFHATRYECVGSTVSFLRNPDSPQPAASTTKRPLNASLAAW